MAEREGLQQLCQAKRSSRVWREKENKMPSSSRGRDKKTKEKKQNKNERTHTLRDTDGGEGGGRGERGRGNKVRKDKNLRRHRECWGKRDWCLTSGENGVMVMGAEGGGGGGSE